jgi:alpha-1,2-mannosyltransferase
LARGRFAEGVVKRGQDPPRTARSEGPREDHAPERALPEWVEHWGPRVFGVGLGLFLLTSAIWVAAYSNQVDMTIFRFGGQAILSHTPLYTLGAGGLPNKLLFNYPPFAALMFTVLAPLPLLLLRVLFPIGNIILLMLVIRRCWQALGIREGRDLHSLTLLSSGVLLWLEPVRTTISLGQINLLLMALVVFDLLPTKRPRWWAGVGVGLAAGIKLTPLLFIPYLLFTKRIRAALVASATFLTTVLLGFLLAPSQAHIYWFGGVFGDLSRISGVAYVGNQSLMGMLARFSAPATPSTVGWAIIAVPVSVVSLIVAALAHRRGFLVLGIAICGMGSAAVSPYSWGYHWVWFVPLAVFLADAAIIGRSKICGWLLGLLLMATTAWMTTFPSPLNSVLPSSGLYGFRVGGSIGMAIHNLYVATFLLTLSLAAALLLRGRSTDIQPSRTRTNP